MTDAPPTGPAPDLDAFAALLTDWCVQAQPGDRVGVFTSTLGAELAVALHRTLLQRDAWPYVRLEPPGLARDFYRHGKDRHRATPPPTDVALAEALDAFVRIDAPANATELADVDPALVTAVATARRPLQEKMLALRWTGTLLPTPALAQQAQMATAQYAAFVNRALFLDRPDPIAAWRELSDRQARLVMRLAQAREVRIEAEGTDLRLGVAGRTWVNSDGRHNMPSGEVFTGPHERSAEGTVRFTVPTGPRGVTVTGVQLRFHEGEVVSATAERGDEYLQAALATDAGARFLGELGIGTNVGIDRPTGHILLDEKMAGTVHLALGRSYPETGGTNVSALHWDLICDLRQGGRLSADGESVVQDGSLRV
ncbi:MAG TPA: aminopeptidase [Solirubrobacteraceae bacterium]|jgi:aminopeptidase|nr:aminopeptidase [Solirubrobacteraceae bacterium]